MKKKMNRRDFVITGAAAGMAAAAGQPALATPFRQPVASEPSASRSPEMHTAQGTTPMVISDYSGFG